MPEIEDKYHLLKELEKEEGQSQRNLANQLGFSLGKINFLIKSLVEVGIIKIDNFAHNKNKTQYSYILTPKGISEKVKITKAFIARKEKEYEKIQIELEEAKKTIKN
jgi:EPS-associated MarR family transcriptional regulator